MIDLRWPWTGAGVVVLTSAYPSGKYMAPDMQRQDTYWRTRAQVSAVVSRLLTFNKLRNIRVVVWDWEATVAEMRWVVLEPFVQLAKVVKVVIQKKEEVGILSGARKCEWKLATEFPVEYTGCALTRDNTRRRAHA